MSERALELIRRAKVERWKMLDLGLCGILGAVPEAVGELTDLEELIICDEWWNWEHMNDWNQSTNRGDRNYVKKLCAGLSNLLLLRKLIIAGDQHYYIPDVGFDHIGKLKSLEFLDLSFTRLRDLSIVSQLENLRVLVLTETDIQELDLISGMNNLQKLVVRETLIVELAPISTLKNLIYLDLSNTGVISLLPIRNLIEKGMQVRTGNDNDGINIEGLELENPPYEIAKQGNKAILNYWREQDRVGTQPAREIKLFLLGNTTAGKSTLAHALIHSEFPKDEHASTLGADLSQSWQPENTDLQVNIWDFGGQEYFHATHGLLMNDDAVYVVACDPAFDKDGFHPTLIRHFGDPGPMEEELEHFQHGYWLHCIRDHARNSKTLFVWNKLDQQDCPAASLSDADKALFNAPASIHEYPNSLQGAFKDKTPKWKLKWETFQLELLDTITQSLKGKEVIQYWPLVREAIAERSKTAMCIPMAEFERIAKDDDPLRELGNIIIYLRDMCGAILYFDTPELRDKVFINPNQINELIYAVLNRSVKGADGRFDRSHALTQVAAKLRELYKEGAEVMDTEAFTQDLLAVMLEFKIIFHDKAGGYVAPQYLPREEPTHLKSELKRAKLEPAFAIRFPRYIPRHIIPRFIAEKGLFAKEETFWKYGILYEETPDADAFVQVRYPDGLIEVSMRAKAQHGAELRGVFGMLRGLIGRDDSFEVSVDGEGFVDFAELKKLHEMAAQKVPTQGGGMANITPFTLFLPKHIPDTTMKKIFISYSAKDQAFKDEFDTATAVLRRSGKVEFWHMGMNVGGDDWDKKVQEQLDGADIVVMLLSPDFFRSDYIWEKEFINTVARWEAKKVNVAGIVLTKCEWRQTRLGAIHLLGSGKEVDLAPNRNEAWLKVVEDLRKML